MQSKLNFSSKTAAAAAAAPTSDKMQVEDDNQKVKNNQLAALQGKKIQNEALLPWVEKYRPNTLNDISHQEEVTRSLQGVLNTGNLPHLLLYGPPGTGKTSSILALSKQLFGPDFFRQRVLELNASDDRGIQVVREKVKKFAQQMVAKNPDRNYLCPTYKIIILDEADSMTTEAQSALRRIIEDNSSSTRFCIICNYITKIIEPLASRCVKFRFQPIAESAQLSKLHEICQAERIRTDDTALKRLIEISGGDMRKSVNLLQSASQLYDRNVELQFIDNISGIVPASEITQLVQTLFRPSLQHVINGVRSILQLGYAPDELKKARIFEKIALCDKGLNEGADYELQLLDLMSQSYSILNSIDFLAN